MRTKLMNRLWYIAMISLSDMKTSIYNFIYLSNFYQIRMRRWHGRSRLTPIYTPEAIHHFFSLSYAQYLAIPRSVLQSMPQKWQHDFKKLLDQLWLTNWHEYRPENTEYHIQLREMKYNLNGQSRFGKIVEDPLLDYDRGRRVIILPKQDKP